MNVGEIVDVLQDSYIAFQPIFNIRSQKIFAIEAFLRRKGMDAAPLDVFQVAINSGTIGALDARIHLMAVDAMPSNIECRLFLNCHPYSLDDLFQHSKLDAGIRSNIVLEITEVERISEQQLKDFCDQAKEQGYSIALDDFGSGYNNVSILDAVRPHFIKIDQSIIHKCDRPIIKKYMQIIKEWAGENQAEIIAEGIETKVHLQHVLQSGINYAQGYLLGEPDPVVQTKYHPRIAL